MQISTETMAPSSTGAVPTPAVDSASSGIAVSDTGFASLLRVLASGQAVKSDELPLADGEPPEQTAKAAPDDQSMLPLMQGLWFRPPTQMPDCSLSLGVETAIDAHSAGVSVATPPAQPVVLDHSLAGIEQLSTADASVSIAASPVQQPVGERTIEMSLNKAVATDQPVVKMASNDSVDWPQNQHKLAGERPASGAPLVDQVASQPEQTIGKTPSSVQPSIRTAESPMLSVTSVVVSDQAAAADESLVASLAVRAEAGLVPIADEAATTPTPVADEAATTPTPVADEAEANPAPEAKVTVARLLRSEETEQMLEEVAEAVSVEQVKAVKLAVVTSHPQATTIANVSHGQVSKQQQPPVQLTQAPELLRQGGFVEPDVPEIDPESAEQPVRLVWSVGAKAKPQSFALLQPIKGYEQVSGEPEQPQATGKVPPLSGQHPTIVGGYPRPLRDGPAVRQTADLAGGKEQPVNSGNGNISAAVQVEQPQMGAVTIVPQADAGVRPPEQLWQALEVGVKQIQAAPDHGDVTVRMQLYPEELGEVRVSLKISNGIVTARFEAATEEATQVIRQNLPSLRTALDAQGWSQVSLSAFSMDSGNADSSSRRFQRSLLKEERGRGFSQRMMPERVESLAGQPMQNVSRLDYRI